MKLVAAWLDRVMAGKGDPAVNAAVRSEICALCAKFPLPH
jgi:glycine/serine hydroxymethyltransferase